MCMHECMPVCLQRPEEAPYTREVELYAVIGCLTWYIGAGTGTQVTKSPRLGDFSAGLSCWPHCYYFQRKKQGREIEIIACLEEQKWCAAGLRPVDSVGELGVGVGWEWDLNT